MVHARHTQHTSISPSCSNACTLLKEKSPTPTFGLSPRSHGIPLIMFFCLSFLLFCFAAAFGAGAACALVAFVFFAFGAQATMSEDYGDEIYEAFNTNEPQVHAFATITLPLNLLQKKKEHISPPSALCLAQLSFNVCAGFHLRARKHPISRSHAHEKERHGAKRQVDMAAKRKQDTRCSIFQCVDGRRGALFSFSFFFFPISFGSTTVFFDHTHPHSLPNLLYLPALLADGRRLLRRGGSNLERD